MSTWLHNSRYTSRMRKEMEAFVKAPPHGISCTMKNEDPPVLAATIIGAEGTPYEGGIFHLELHMPDNYPFYPPQVRFLTPIFHPNIDEQGRICLDLLRNPPTGAWRCTSSVVNLLGAIQCLMAQPNPADPLCPDIADLYLNNRELYNQKAKELTEKEAKSETPPPASEDIPFVPLEELNENGESSSEQSTPSKNPRSSDQSSGESFISGATTIFSADDPNISDLSTQSFDYNTPSCSSAYFLQKDHPTTSGSSPVPGPSGLGFQKACTSTTPGPSTAPGPSGLSFQESPAQRSIYRPDDYPEDVPPIKRDFGDDSSDEDDTQTKRVRFF